MKPLERSELLDLTAYEKARSAALARVIALKRPRRIALGPELTFIFENRDSVWFQVQEMLRTERIVEDAAIQNELDVYNELLPKPDGLSATLMVEITDAGRIRETLDRLVGIDEHIFLELGAERVRASFDPKQFEQDRISAVQYVRFALGPVLAARFRDPSVPVALCAAHPAYPYRCAIEKDARESLARDLDPDA